MKKVLFAVAAVVVALSFASCKKTCKCTEKNSGATEKIKTDKEFKSCDDIEDALNSIGMLADQDWSCK